VWGTVLLLPDGVRTLYEVTGSWSIRNFFSSPPSATCRRTWWAGVRVCGESVCGEWVCRQMVRVVVLVLVLVLVVVVVVEDCGLVCGACWFDMYK
jgi:hypothetical protein